MRIGDPNKNPAKNTSNPNPSENPMVPNQPTINFPHRIFQPRCHQLVVAMSSCHRFHQGPNPSRRRGSATKKWLEGEVVWRMVRGWVFLPNFYRDYFINHEIRIPINQPGFSGKYEQKFQVTKNGGTELNLISGYFGGLVFPYMSRIYTAYIGFCTSTLGIWNVW